MTSASATATVSKVFGGRQAGTALMVLGLVLAGAAFALVLSMARRSQAAAAQGVRQVYVVMATRDIPEYTPIRADSVAIKAFPAAFAPVGATSTLDDVVGKFATTNIVRDQMVLSSQVATTRRSPNLSATIPSGRVAFWMPLPDLLGETGGLQAGDRVDILLSVPLVKSGSAGGSAASGASSGGDGRGIATQTTLQNVEVYLVGSATNDLASNSPGVGLPGAPAASRPGAKVVAFLLDPQDAVLAKYIKDSGGTIDLVLRSRETSNVVSTESVTADTLVDRFKFRVPEQWTIGGR